MQTFPYAADRWFFQTYQVVKSTNAITFWHCRICKIDAFEVGKAFYIFVMNTVYWYILIVFPKYWWYEIYIHLRIVLQYLISRIICRKWSRTSYPFSVVLVKCDRVNWLIGMTFPNENILGTLKNTPGPQWFMKSIELWGGLWNQYCRLSAASEQIWWICHPNGLANFDHCRTLSNCIPIQ